MDINLIPFLHSMSFFGFISIELPVNSGLPTCLRVEIQWSPSSGWNWKFIPFDLYYMIIFSHLQFQKDFRIGQLDFDQIHLTRYFWRNHFSLVSVSNHETNSTLFRRFRESKFVDFLGQLSISNQISRSWKRMSHRFG